MAAPVQQHGLHRESSGVEWNQAVTQLEESKQHIVGQDRVQGIGGCVCASSLEIINKTKGDQKQVTQTAK